MIRAVAIDDEPLALKVIETLCRKHSQVELLQTFTQPNEALRYLKIHECDLLFCDIQMPAMTGINLVKSLPENILVVFTTAFSEYAAVSYELNAIDYLLKPINQARFAKAIDKSLEYIDYLHRKNVGAELNIFVRSEFSLVKIPMNEILYIEGLADYLKIHIRDRKTIMARMTMKDMMDKLNSQDFVRIHRSFILPINSIEAVRGNTVLSGGTEFPLGRTYAAEFLKRFT